VQFNSYSYLILLGLAVAVFWALPSHFRRWFVLTLSILFYALWNPLFVLAPAALCLGVFLAGIKIAARGSRERMWFLPGVICALGFLIFFRYQVLWEPPLQRLASSFSAAPGLTLLRFSIPLGISFYTFEAISYLVDIRQRRIQPTRFTDLLLFVMFWPHLVAGPIVRFRELIPQFECKKRFDIPLLLGGLDRLIFGLVQKNLIADPLGRWVDEGFATQIPGASTTLDNWFLAIAFGLQIYFDFSAYTNMAIGTAKLIGIDLPENFRFPYHAKNPAEFWKRWHMTLSRWIRDYLFFPLNVRFRGAPLPLYLSLIGVMGLVGLWHGAGWGFVFWGLLHGCYLAAYRTYETLQTKYSPGYAASRIIDLLWRGFTLVAVMAAWIPFRATSAAQSLDMLGSMFLRLSFRITLPINFYLIVLLVAAFTFAEPYIQNGFAALDLRIAHHARLLFAQYYFLRPILYAFGMLLFLSFDGRNTQFIYFQF
jgi:alginate O-acetyltransferase complex protein AlgI